MQCRGGDCKHYTSLDDGEDENGNPYPPNPYCEACQEFLDEPELGECLDESKFEPLDWLKKEYEKC